MFWVRPEALHARMLPLLAFKLNETSCRDLEDTGDQQVPENHPKALVPFLCNWHLAQV